jgi:hypothetical protein
VAGFCEHSNKPSDFINCAGNFVTSRRPISFSSRLCSINHGRMLDSRCVESQIEAEVGSLLAVGVWYLSPLHLPAYLKYDNTNNM